MHNKTLTKKPMITLSVFVLFLSLGLLAGCTAKDQTPNNKGATNKTAFEIPENTFDETNLQGETIEEAFSFDQSLYRVNQIRESLDSFRSLTEHSKGKLPDDVLEQVGNTGWEMQNLGFHNLPNIIEGTLRFQNYRIKELEYILAIKKCEGDEIKEEDALKAQGIYNDAKDDMQGFLDTYLIAD